MKRFSYLFLALVFGIVLVSAGCGSKKEDKPGAVGGDKPKEVVIGFTGPLSGPGAEFGMDCLNGVDMAVKEINQAGGITVNGNKYVFKLEKLDDLFDPTSALNNARRFRSQYKTPAIFNVSSAPLVQINLEKGEEFINMAFTSSPKYIQQNNSLTVATPPPNTAYVYAFADMAKAKGWKKVAMVVSVGPYGDEWRASFRKRWTEMGGEITADSPANYYTETDYSSQLTTALATKPDALLIGGPSVTTALAIEQARTLGFKGGFILIDQAKMDYIENTLKGLSLMENTIGVGIVAQIPGPGGMAFDKKYTETYKKFNTWDAALNYTGMHALAKAMAAANSVDNPITIRKAFPQVFPMLGDVYPTEYYGISDKGRVYCMSFVQTIENGKYGSATLYMWWPKDEQEFNKYRSMFKFTGAEVKYLKVEE